MSFTDEIDEDEHAYWRAFCPVCGTSPCSLQPGETDEDHPGGRWRYYSYDSREDWPRAWGMTREEYDRKRRAAVNQANVRELLTERFPRLAGALNAFAQTAIKENA